MVAVIEALQAHTSADVLDPPLQPSWSCAPYMFLVTQVQALQASRNAGFMGLICVHACSLKSETWGQNLILDRPDAAYC